MDINMNSVCKMCPNCEIIDGTNLTEESCLQDILKYENSNGRNSRIICRPEFQTNCLWNCDFIIEIEKQIWLLDHTRITWPSIRSAQIKERRNSLEKDLDLLGRKYGCYILVNFVEEDAVEKSKRRIDFREILDKIETLLNKHSLVHLARKNISISSRAIIQVNPVALDQIHPDSQLGIIGTSMGRNLPLVDSFLLDTGPVIRKKLSSQVNPFGLKGIKVGLILDQYGLDDPGSSHILNTVISSEGITNGLDSLEEDGFIAYGYWLRNMHGEIERLK